MLTFLAHKFMPSNKPLLILYSLNIIAGKLLPKMAIFYFFKTLINLD